MSRTLFKHILTICAVFSLSLSAALAQEPTVADLVNDIRRGSGDEKLEASKKIVAFGQEGNKAERALKKLVGSVKDPERALVYLNALLAVSDDGDDDAYKRYTKNGVKQKGKKREKANKVRDFFQELGNVENVRDSLIPYVKSLRENDKVPNYIVTNILASLAKNHPDKLPEILGNFADNTRDNIAILNGLDSGAEDYIDDVKAVVASSPKDAISFLIKNDAVDQGVIDYAIANSGPSNKPNNSYLPMGAKTGWHMALDVLVMKEAESEAAYNKLVELLKTEAWSDITKSIDAHGEISDRLTNEVKNIAFANLESGIISTNSRSNLEYNLCLTIAGGETTDERHKQILLNKATSTTDASLKLVCTYALKSISEPTGAINQYLEGLLQDNTDQVADSVQTMLNLVITRANEMKISQFRKSMTPELLPLYAAHVLLENDPTHAGATDIIEKYYDKKFSIMRFDRDGMINTHISDIGFPSAMGDGGVFSTVFAETTPFEAKSLTLAGKEGELEKFINDALQSDSNVRAINAARLIVDGKTKVNGTIQETLVKKLASYEHKSMSVIFIRALEYVEPNEATMSLLKELSEEKYVTRKNAARDVLQSYESD